MEVISDAKGMNKHKIYIEVSLLQRHVSDYAVCMKKLLEILEMHLKINFEAAGPRCVMITDAKLLFF